MSQFCTCTGGCRKRAGSKLGEGWVCVLDILPERRKSDNWRPIKTAPEGIYVIAFGEYYGRRPMLAMKTGGVWYEGNKPIEPTHWTEIPPLPVKEL